MWGATVITSLASAIPLIGEHIVSWLWGGYSVDNATLGRFYSIHYITPMLLGAMVILHISYIHSKGSSSFIASSIIKYDQLTLYPHYLVKDTITMSLGIISIIILACYYSEYLGHSDNSIEANKMVTPIHIVPEWYFLPYYAILRSVPHKLGGVITMASAIILLLSIPVVNTRNNNAIRYMPSSKMITIVSIISFLVLGIIGGRPVTEPYIIIGQVSTVYFICWICILLPSIESLESAIISREV